MWIDLYDAVTTKAGRSVQGGGCTTVGVAGLIQSGGFGSFSKAFGTAASSLLEAEIVTADGAVRIANACTNPDLFWALKGGGGGSWGVVTKLTLKTHNLPEHLGSAEGKIKAVTDDAFRQLISRFIAFYAESLFNPHWGEQVSLSPDNTLKISMVCEGIDKQQAVNAWQPFFEWVKRSPKLFTVTDELYAGAGPAQHWWDAVYRKSKGSESMIQDPRPEAPPTHAWWSGDQEQVGAFLHGYESLWLPASLLQPPLQSRLADALVAASRYKEVELHFNKGLAGAPADAIVAAKKTATNPAVTQAFALAIVADGEMPAYPGFPREAVDTAAAHKNARLIELAAAELQKIAPGAGSYVSESNYFNARWQQAFWGENYSRLRAVKDKYDPDGLFFVHHGVGSEDWSTDGFTRVTRLRR
jgi:FAD/FMN-containing dehydrogenase